MSDTSKGIITLIGIVLMVWTVVACLIILVA